MVQIFLLEYDDTNVYKLSINRVEKKKKKHSIDMLIS